MYVNNFAEYSCDLQAVPSSMADQSSSQTSVNFCPL